MKKETPIVEQEGLHDWSIKQVQDMVSEREEWTKKNVYVTDCGKCPAGVYFALKGIKTTNPIPAKNMRRMEVGTFIEQSFIKKLKSLGILLSAQDRLFDEAAGLSGRPDAIIISPTSCTDEAKGWISERVELYKLLKNIDKDWYDLLRKEEAGELSTADFLKEETKLNKKKRAVYAADKRLQDKLLVPDPQNSLMVAEVKSIVSTGFTWRKKEGKPMEDHEKQDMFYLWKLRAKYPWMIGRVVYVSTDYQELLEFNVDVDEDKIQQMLDFATYVNKCAKDNVQPEPAPDVIRNPMTGKWQVNTTASWCDYHIQCTGNADWLAKAFDKVELLNQQDIVKGRD